MRELTGSLQWLSLNTATVREQWDLPQVVEGCARYGIRGIAPWRDQIQAMGAAEAGTLIREHGLIVSGLCRAGMFTAADAAGRQAAIDDNLRAIDEAAAIGAKCLVLLGGGLPEGSKDLSGARAQVRDGIAAVLPHARTAGVPLAIEPLHPMFALERCCVSTLAQANDLCDELAPDDPCLGVAVDVYHVHWDPMLGSEIERAGHRILAFHVNDWLTPTKHMLLDRGMMGDGLIDIPQIRGLVEDQGYEGLIEVEIFSRDDWWRRDPEEVLRIIVQRYQTVV
ncbi:MAG: sugar phosphate isomerase/epimerase family protein [Pseudomonadota bacterium]